MEKKFIESLKIRRIQLQEELKHIDSLLEIYNLEKTTKSSARVGSLTKTSTSPTAKKPTTKKRRGRKRKVKAEDQLVKVINELGGRVYINDVVERLQQMEPKTELKTLQSRARNYIQQMKKKGMLSVEPAEGRKVRYVLNVVQKSSPQKKTGTAGKSVTSRKAANTKQAEKKPAAVAKKEEKKTEENAKKQSPPAATKR